MKKDIALLMAIASASAQAQGPLRGTALDSLLSERQEIWAATYAACLTAEEEVDDRMHSYDVFQQAWVDLRLQQTLLDHSVHRMAAYHSNDLHPPGPPPPLDPERIRDDLERLTAFREWPSVCRVSQDNDFEIHASCEVSRGRHGIATLYFSIERPADGRSVAVNGGMNVPFPPAIRGRASGFQVFAHEEMRFEADGDLIRPPARRVAPMAYFDAEGSFTSRWIPVDWNSRAAYREIRRGLIDPETSGICSEIWSHQRPHDLWDPTGPFVREVLLDDQAPYVSSSDASPFQTRWSDPFRARQGGSATRAY